jgi:glycosyltransferase involved in cell wall biosynthesis
VLSLAEGLDRRHYHLTVALPENLKPSIDAFQQTGVKVVPLSMRKVVWASEAIAALVRLVRDEDFDIVHIHSQEAGLLGRLVAWSSGAQTILYTPQTLDIRRARWHRLYRLSERILARITSAVISVNESDRGRLIAWGIPPQKVTTIHNGIDLTSFKEPIDARGLRQSLGLDKYPPLVMQVGRLSAQKDPLAFVEGAAQVVRQYPRTQFALVGDGPLRDAVIARIRELGLGECVHWLGWHNDAFRLIGAANVVTLTSKWEGAPYALLEAMAWSRPVVATAVNGCPEIVVDGVTGFLVPPGDTTAWARRVRELLDNPAHANIMGQQGRKRVEEKFTLQEMLGRLETLYCDMRHGYAPP